MEGFSRRQGFQLMLGATQAILLGAAGCHHTDYAATVVGIPGLVAYWRFSDLSGIYDQTSGGRHGSYDGAVALAPGLPAGSDKATSFLGTVVGTVPHDAGLALPALTLSLWVRLNEVPSNGTAIVSKDQSGLSDGDFALIVDEDGELLCQFQSGAAALKIAAHVEPNAVYHLVVTADAAGFSLWIDGQQIAASADFTNAWTNNSQPIQFATAPWTSEVLAMDIDEVALWDRVLSDAQIIQLSQRIAAPVAVADSAVVPENQSTLIDVVANDTHVGRKSSLSVELWDGGDWGSSVATIYGMATVSGQAVEFEANAVSDDQSDSFQYRITDANGSSNAATVTLSVQNNESVGGGTLVYRWQPRAEWIDGVPLSERNASAVRDLSRWTDPDAATVGSNLPRSLMSSSQTGSGNGHYCFNRAPTGEPSIENWATPSVSAGVIMTNVQVQLYEEFTRASGGPAHLRLVIELKTCKPGDPTAYKANGLGTTSGSFPSWRDTHVNPGNGTNAACKYFAGLIAGATTGPYGGGRCNWWNGQSVPETVFKPDRMGARTQSNRTPKTIAPYYYKYDRPNQFGGSQEDSTPTAKLIDPGIEGYWHRLEIELKLSDPETVPNDAIYNNPPIDPRPNNGNAFVKHYVTRDIDGELGSPGTVVDGVTLGVRELFASTTGGISFCMEDNVYGLDNMHIDANIVALWLNYYYGGSIGCQGEGWSWIRKVEVYRHD